MEEALASASTNSQSPKEKSLLKLREVLCLLVALILMVPCRERAESLPLEKGNGREMDFLHSSD